MSLGADVRLWAPGPEFPVDFPAELKLERLSSLPVQSGVMNCPEFSLSPVCTGSWQRAS